LQEIIYRALEREPRNRYASAREFAHDLEHQDQVGVASREETANWKRKESPPAHRNLLIATFVVIPLLILALLLLVARHH
jgi:serine/threonine-protein kinase